MFCEKSYFLWEFQAETLYAYSKPLGTQTKFQLEIITILNVISGIVYFHEIILESSPTLVKQPQDLRWNIQKYRQVSNIRRTLVGN